MSRNNNRYLVKGNRIMHNGQRIPIDVPLLGQGPPQAILGVQNVPGPSATPVTFPIQTERGVVVRQVGGLMRLDHIAATIAAEQFSRMEFRELDTPEQRLALMRFCAGNVVDFAEAVLAELNARHFPALPAKETPTDDSP